MGAIVFLACILIFSTGGYMAYIQHDVLGLLVTVPISLTCTVILILGGINLYKDLFTKEGI